MNLTKAGKKCLQHYINNLTELLKTVERTEPVNSFLLKQIDSLLYITKQIQDAWDTTFELSLLKNAGSYFNCYNVVNGGDGSWAIALSDDNSRAVAILTIQLFEEFKYHLSDYINGLPEDSNEIKMFGIKIAYSNPKSIIASAICQMKAAIQFYDYLATEASLIKRKNAVLSQLPTDFNDSPLANEEISRLITEVCDIPSSYLRNRENRTLENNIARVMRDSTTGALGYLCQLGLIFYLESYALSNTGNRVTFSNHIQPTSAVNDLCIKLNEFVHFASAFAKETHADYKIDIISSLSHMITEQLKVIATKERLGCYHTETYSQMYLSGKKLEYLYDNKMSDIIIREQRGHTLKTIKHYLDELKKNVSQETLKPILSRYDKLTTSTTTSIDDISYFIVEINRFISEKIALPPTMIIHRLLKFVSEINLRHVNLVKMHNHTLGQTGDKINDLYSYLLTSFTQFRLADEPMTHIHLRLIDNLINAMSDELSASKQHQCTALQTALRSSGSPVYSSQSMTESKKSNHIEDDIRYKFQTRSYD